MDFGRALNKFPPWTAKLASTSPFTLEDAVGNNTHAPVSDGISWLDFVSSNIWSEIFKNFSDVYDSVSFSSSLKGVETKLFQSFPIVPTLVIIYLSGKRPLNVLYLLDKACFDWTP